MSFADLLDDALFDVRRADIQGLRDAWVASEGQERTFWDDEAFEELHLRLETSRWDDAVDLAEDLLEAHPLSVELRLWYARALSGNGEEREASRQRALANALLRAVLRSGDGRTVDTALQVICSREQVLVLSMMGLTPQRSELREQDGCWVDRVEATNAEGQLQTLYFRVAVPEGWVSPS